MTTNPRELALAELTLRELRALSAGVWLLEAHACDGYPEDHNFTDEYLANPLSSPELRALDAELGELIAVRELANELEDAA